MMSVDWILLVQIDLEELLMGCTLKVLVPATISHQKDRCIEWFPSNWEETYELSF